MLGAAPALRLGAELGRFGAILSPDCTQRVSRWMNRLWAFWRVEATGKT